MTAIEYSHNKFIRDLTEIKKEIQKLDTILDMCRERLKEESDEKP